MKKYFFNLEIFYNFVSARTILNSIRMSKKRLNFVGSQANLLVFTFEFNLPCSGNL